MPPPTPRAVALLIALVAGALAAPAAGYVRSRTNTGAPMEWNQRVIAWSLNEQGSDDIDIEALEIEVIDSFGPWTEWACADLEFPYEGLTARGADLEDIGYEIGGDNINVVVFREERDLWLHQSNVIAVTTVTFCDEAGGICDLAGEILDADIEVNGANFSFNTSDGPAATRFDLRNTLTHEAGHFIGFDHSPEADATMFASAPPGETSKRDLAEDDIDGLCDVYSTIYDERNTTEGCECRAVASKSAPGWGALALLAALLIWRPRRARSPRHRR